MTSLAQQLQRLAVPQVQATFAEDKKKASLLFEPKEAASIDRETFHAIGLNGFEELESLDPKFQEFESTLFGDSSMMFERSVQTKDVNQKLDETIKRFLVRLSPYCLLKPAHKALEWLIHRFHIHLYNSDELIKCFLPYHESKIFIRVLQLITFNSKLASKWDWLEPIQISGVHLPRTTLINHCMTNANFLSFVCDMVPDAVKVLTKSGETVPKCRVLFSFYATTIIGVLDAGDLSETLLGALLAHLARGLRSPVLEYKAATYMILAQMLHKATLKAELLKRLEQLVAKSLVADLLGEGMACLLLMFQKQDMSQIKVTKKSFNHLCRHYSIVDTIITLSDQFDSEHFLSCFLDRLIPAAFKHAVGIATSGESSDSEASGVSQPHMSLLHKLLSSIQLPDHMAEQAAFTFLEVFVRHGCRHLDEDIDDRIKDSLQGIVRQLEGKNSDAVDRAVSRMMSQCSDNQSNLVKEFLNLYVLSVPRQLVTDSETSLVLSLNHRLASVRETAVKTLLQNRNGLDSEEFLKNSLEARLRDDDCKVVTAALNIGKDLWSVMEDDRLTIKLLRDIVWRGLANETWFDVACQSIQILGVYKGDHYKSIITSCLPCFCINPRSKQKLVIIKSLFSSPLSKNYTLLSTISKEWKKMSAAVEKDSDNASKINIALAQCVAKGLKAMDTEQQLEVAREWCNFANESRNVRITLLMMMVLAEMVSMETDAEHRLQLCLLEIRLVVQAFKRKRSYQKPLSLNDLKGCLEQNATWKTSSKVPAVACLIAIQSVIGAVNTPASLTGVHFWQMAEEGGHVTLYLKVCVELFRLLLQASAGNGKTPSGDVTVSRTLMKTFEQECFSDSACYLKFLGLLWTCPMNDHASDLGMNLNLQARAVTLGLAYISNLSDEELKTLLEKPFLLMNILLLLKTPQSSLRQEAVSYITVLLDRCGQLDSVYPPLMKKLVKCSTELVADADFINQVLASFFKSTSLSGEGASPGKRSVRKGRKSTSGGSETKDVKRECLMNLLAALLDQHCPFYVQLAMLDVLSALNNTSLLCHLLPLMERLISLDPSTSPSLAPHCLNLVVRRFTPETGECLAPGSKGLKLYLSVLRCHQIQGDDSPQMVALQQITKELYSEIPGEAQHQLLAAMYDVCVETEELGVANQIRKNLKHVSVNGEHIHEELKKCLKVSTAKTVREAKRQRRSMPETAEADEFDSATWQRVTIILETVQMKKKLQNYTVLVPVCFQIMAVILESNSHHSAEYIKQLLLTLMYTICGRLERETDEAMQVPEEQFNMELIVQCIRSSDNPQTHHQALLLLTAAAKIYPERLLQNMMSVFTFMGANIMRQDDSYSFLIISKILETVIPALITACNQRTSVPKGITNDQEDIITMVIQVFVDSYKYIPEHRRHLLFKKLLTVIGERQYLWRTQMLMMDLVVTKGNLRAELSSDTQETTESLSSSDMEFCLTLSADFSPGVQLSSARDMILYLSMLPDEKLEGDKPIKRPVPQSFGKLRKDDVKLFNVDLHTGKQLRHFKYAVIHLLNSLFSSTHFIAQISENEDEELLQQFQALLESVLQLISHVTMVTNKAADKASAKYWKALQHKVHDLLDKLVSLLPDSLFLEVIGGLLPHDLPTIQRKAMELLSAKLQQQKVMSDAESQSLLPLVNQLLELVQNLTSGRTISDESSVNSQTAFICLKLLCRYIGFQHPALFTQVLKTAVDVFKNRHVSVQVSSCALLCMAEICNTLKVHVISHLTTFMPSLLQVMKDTQTLLQNDLYLMSVVTTVNKVVENLSNFLSPYLLDIITCVCVLISQEEEVLQKPQVQLRLKTIRSTIATSLPTRVLLPVVTSSYTVLVKQDRSSVGSLLSLFGDHISYIGREDLTSHLTQLQTFFLQCLDIRIDYPQAPEKEVSKLEEVTIETIITMVMKLSEATFKPFLYKVYDWATSMDDLRERVLVFYRFAERLAERLRSLFTLFAGHIINHAAHMLDSNNMSKEEDNYFPHDEDEQPRSCQLLVYILDCVYKCCLYDTEGFVTKERFDSLSSPLIDQLDNMVGGVVEYKERTTSHLVPCIVQLALAAQDDSLWKTLNYQVCLKTRSGEPEVKIGALEVLDSLHKKLGDDYMPLLPETVPFLAELMEDESDDVEKKCQEVIREMEKTLGEPLQKYF